MRTVLALLLTVLLTSCATTSKNSITKIEGKSHTGKSISIDLNKNKTTVAVFMSAYCPCSKSHTKIIKNLNEKYKDIKFVGIHSNYNERKNKAMEYFKNENFGFPVIHDKESTLAKKLGALKTPHVFVFNNKGEVIYNGSVTDSANAKTAKIQHLDIALNDISKGRQPTIPQKKTLGCYIALKED